MMLAVMCGLVTFFAFATLVGEYGSALREYVALRLPLVQTGDSSLSPQSVNWAGGTAFAAALWICFGLS